MNASDLLRLPGLEDGLAHLEVVLARSVSSDDALMAEVARHLMDAGGKRLRPGLALASAAAGGWPAEMAATEELLLGGVAVELVHLGSLYHDDVMDEASTRRRVGTVNAKWGNLVAVVAGDFLLARASGIAAGLGTEVAELLAATIARLCEGQVREMHSCYDPSRTKASYLTAIAGKTAALMATACRVGAITTGLDRLMVEAVTEFGRSLGMVFQIRDDILDLVGTEAELGKPPGQDLVEGVYTLPVIEALGDPGLGEELRRALGRPLDPEGRDYVRYLVAETDGLKRAGDAATGFAREAREALAIFGDNPVARALGALPQSLLEGIAEPWRAPTP
ncbi:MAG: polyprenyl synthetase family protein [Acidimicrobiales bacterium]